MEALCQCGSGLPFARCHGDSRNDYARRQALAEARGIGAMFPFVRVRGVDRMLDAVVRSDESAELEPLLTEIPGGEWRRVVDSFAAPYADRWESLTNTAGDVAAAERELVLGALAVALDERAPTPLDIFAGMEESPRLLPANALLALAVPPMFIWSVTEANAGQAAADGRRNSSQRMQAVQDVGFALVTFAHLERARSMAARLADELPFAGLSNTSRALGNACAQVADSLDAAREAAVASLIAYVEQRIAARANWRS